MTIVAGCGIHNAGGLKSEHDGIHAFHIGKNATVLYIEKHYGEGEGTGERILNPTTIVEIDENGSMTMETAQIKGVDSAVRKTSATLKDGATLVIHEKSLRMETICRNAIPRCAQRQKFGCARCVESNRKRRFASEIRLLYRRQQSLFGTHRM